MKEIMAVGVIGKFGDPSVADTLKSLAAFLLDSQRKVVLDHSTAKIINQPELEGYSRDQIGEACDLCIVVGGDGTILNAARSLVEHEVPLLGVNLGRLGFLSDISPAELTTRLADILAGEYVIEKRVLLHAIIERNGEILSESNAFNDVVIHKNEVGRMIELETYVNGRFVNIQRSDGLVVSTPTGSTAYALSGGGPLMHPNLNAIVMVPICPHTLSNRPIVVDADTQIDIILHDNNYGNAQVTCDGQIKIALEPADCIRIYKKEKAVQLIHPKGYDYFEILRAKLRWAEKL